MHPNVEVVMAGFQAFAAGDMGALRAMFSDDAVWHTSGRNRFSGDHAGADNIMQLMQDVGAAATIVNEPHAVLADDDHVVVLSNSSLSRGDKAVSLSTTFVFHVSDGKVTEVWGSPFEQYAADEFWAD